MKDEEGNIKVDLLGPWGNHKSNLGIRCNAQCTVSFDWFMSFFFGLKTQNMDELSLDLIYSSTISGKMSKVLVNKTPS